VPDRAASLRDGLASLDPAPTHEDSACEEDRDRVGEGGSGHDAMARRGPRLWAFVVAGPCGMPPVPCHSVALALQAAVNCDGVPF